MEAIGEMQVLTNGYNAEYGRGAGGVVECQHQERHQRAARHAFRDTCRTPTSMPTAGRTIGGGRAKGRFQPEPVRRSGRRPHHQEPDVHFRRLSREPASHTSGGTIQNLGYGGFYTIPTAAMRQGDFPGCWARGCSRRPGVGHHLRSRRQPAINAGVYSRTPFANNTIPITRFDPAAAKIAALYPATNQPIATGGFPVNDYYVVHPRHADHRSGRSPRRPPAHRQGQLVRNHELGRHAQDEWPAFPGALDGAPFQGASEVDLNRNAMLSWTRVWTPT